MWNTAGLDPELVIDPQTKPATEFVLDEYVQKMSPRGWHSFAQKWFTLAFERFAEEAGRGRSGPEWDFLVTLPGESPKHSCRTLRTFRTRGLRTRTTRRHRFLASRRTSQ